MLFNAFLQAIREIKRNLLRSMLTAIGIVIGIASVIAMVNIGKGASASITNSISKLGSNTLYIIPGQGHHGPGGQAAVVKPFDIRDVKAIKTSILALSAVSPAEGSSMTVLRNAVNYQTNVLGVNNDYFKIQNWTTDEGRYFDQRELRIGRNVCILGQTVYDKLFPSKISPIGHKIRLQNLSCTVVGLLHKKGANTFGRDQDDIVLVPIKMFQRRISGNQNIHLIMAAVKKNIPLQEAQMQIKELMRQERNIKPTGSDDFSVRSITALLDTISKITSVLTIMLGAVAAISLIVGGIGIMNIMLVSVTERTREIGIRLAVGAMAKDIMIQFLIEATVLSGLGGIVGILAGIGITLGVAHGLHIELILDPSIIIVALFFSMLIGVAFGILPARKAANMNPIDALRYE
jgi:putative ABC transport system permease protein